MRKLALSFCGLFLLGGLVWVDYASADQECLEAIKRGEPRDCIGEELQRQNEKMSEIMRQQREDAEQRSSEQRARESGRTNQGGGDKACSEANMRRYGHLDCRATQPR